MTYNNYLKTYQEGRGLGPWRSLYLQILSHMDATSILEAGAGSPAFLDACQIPNKTAVDIEDTHAEAFTSRGIAFRQKNLDFDDLSDLGAFSVIVCSDVFEHLQHPLLALTHLHGILLPEGLLFSHVPNEFALKKMIKIMLGKKTSVNFHTKNLPDEWNDPHIRRFTDIGYKKLLEQKFEHNIKITQFRYSRFTSFLHKLTMKIPYTLEKGPTYISTNSDSMAKKIRGILEQNNRSLSNYN